MVWLLVGCAAGDSAATITTERDSAGVVIVENRSHSEEWHLASRALLRIGEVEGEAPYQLHNIRFAARLEDGHVVIADGGSREVRWYDASGTHRASVGRRGEAPGEFRGFGSVLVLTGDTLAVHDPGNQRVTWLSPDGSIVRDRRLGIGDGNVRLLAVRDDGRLVVANSRPTFDVRKPDFSYTRDTLGILIHSAEGVDTVARMAGDEAALWVLYQGGRPNRTMQMDLPFAYRTLTGATGEHIVLAVGERNQIELLDASGTLLRIARRVDLESMPVTTQIHDRYTEHVTDAARRRGVGDPSVIEQAARDRLALLEEGHFVPAFDRLLLDSYGRIWLRDYVPVWAADQPQAWAIYEHNGRLAGRAFTHAGLDVTHIARDAIAGVERDEHDVEYVVVYRIERR